MVVLNLEEIQVEVDRASDCSRGINGGIREIGNYVLPLIEKIEPEFIDECITCFVSVEKPKLTILYKFKNPVSKPVKSGGNGI